MNLEIVTNVDGSVDIPGIAEIYRLRYIEKQIGREPDKRDALLFYPVYDNAFCDGISYASSHFTKGKICIGSYLIEQNHCGSIFISLIAGNSKGEAMEIGVHSEKNLLIALDRFWNENF